jgi:phosphoglycerol transferase MdoB-like AlkP superfamily enzyme
MDKCIGDFGKAIEHKVKLPLVVVTADNAVRRKINKTPDLYEKTAIPFVLYGKDVLKGISLPPGAAGSHIDITPTLVELAAPKGFCYHTMGKDLLDPRQRPFGIGLNFVIGPDYLVEVGEKTKVHSLSGKPLPQTVPDVKMLKKFYDSMHGIAWWRIMKGPKV